MTLVRRHLALAIFALLASAARGAGEETPPKRAVVIEGPRAVQADSDLHFRVTGLVPGSTYSLRAEWVSRAGTIWRANADFVAGEGGVVDPGTTAPTTGSYSDVDPVGLVSSMSKTEERTSDASLFENDDRSVLALSVRHGEETLASRRVELRKRAIAVSTTEIREPFSATLLAPYHASRRPALVVLGGSEGGTPSENAALIASHGYVALALPYFYAEGLGDDLDRVPIEIVCSAVEWLSRQPEVDRRRIGVAGWSKGAELALLAGSRCDGLRAIVAVAPASVAFQSLREDRARTSSWTWRGAEVPFAPFAASEAFERSRRHVDLYRAALDAAPPEAEIPIEKVRGPVLLIAGREDALWPSAEMADRLVARSRRLHARYTVENRQYDDAGHHVGRIPLRPTADSVRLGGSAAGIARAQRRSWRELIAFLDRELRLR